MGSSLPFWAWAKLRLSVELVELGLRRMLRLSLELGLRLRLSA